MVGLNFDMNLSSSINYQSISFSIFILKLRFLMICASITVAQKNMTKQNIIHTFEILKQPNNGRRIKLPDSILKF